LLDQFARQCIDMEFHFFPQQLMPFAVPQPVAQAAF
jgi:hypothetical protein